jgi:hypothetical protein
MPIPDMSEPVAPSVAGSRLRGGLLRLAVLTAILSIEAPVAMAQEATPPDQSQTPPESDLAKQAQNPVASLISVPLQNNFNFGVGPNDDLQYVLNIQPVIPFRLSDNWNLISRTILPILYQPPLGPGIGDEFGLGDIQMQFYLSPAKATSFIWGVGPVLQFPTGTGLTLGNEQWAAGPTAVALIMDGPWVVGALANQLWSYGGNRDDGEFSQLTIQPFINYNLPGGWYLVSSPIITANWDAKADDTWTVPLGGGVGKIFKVGHQPINAQLASYYNVERPDDGAEWSIRFQLQLLFPK